HQDSNSAVLQTQDDSSFTYANQLDFTRLSSANNVAANLSFRYDQAPPVALNAYGVAVGNPSAISVPPVTPFVYRVSVNNNGQPANQTTDNPFISRDGRF